MKSGRFGRVLGPFALLSLALLAGPALSQTMQTRPGAPAAGATSPSTGAGASTGTAKMPSSGAATGTTGGAHSLIDINSASAAELDTLPGIGPARADAIIKGRPYRAKNDLVGRHIVPQNVYDGIKDRIVARAS